MRIKPKELKPLKTATNTSQIKKYQAFFSPKKAHTSKKQQLESSIVVSKKDVKERKSTNHIMTKLNRLKIDTYLGGVGNIVPVDQTTRDGGDQQNETNFSHEFNVLSPKRLEDMKVGTPNRPLIQNNMSGCKISPSKSQSSPFNNSRERIQAEEGAAWG